MLNLWTFKVYHRFFRLFLVYAEDVFPEAMRKFCFFLFSSVVLSGLLCRLDVSFLVTVKVCVWE